MEKIFLNGHWSFRTDPQRRGVHEKWYDGHETFEGSISVPGGWLLDGAYEGYHGLGWYKRSFSLTPQQVQKRVTICFGGVYRYADIYVNGSLVLQHEGYQSSFEADISTYVYAGENTITVVADDVRKKHDLMLDGPTVWGMPQMRFAGIYEPVWLELREAVRTVDVYAALTPDLQKIQMQLEMENQTGVSQNVQIDICILDAENTVVKQQSLEHILPVETDVRQITFGVDHIQLWSPETPHLYTIAVTLTTSSVVDNFKQRTGFKYFTVCGKDFYLNGQPYFLRGYGDDFVFPKTAQPSATDKAFYYHGLMRAKEYGFNGARHHSHFPFTPYFEAADELGMLIQPELALANIPIDYFTQESAELFLAEWKALVKEHRHHPCVMAWCGGNEEEWGYFFEDQICALARQIDPYRPVVPTDGRWMAREIQEDDNYDYVSVCYVEYTDVLPLDEYADLYTRDDCGKPQIVHEMGNFTTLCPVHDLPKYQGAKNYPDVWKKWAEEIEAAGRMPLYDRAAANALALQKMCYKLIIEKARQSNAIRGYHLWTLTDYYDTTQGLLNQFYEDKAFTATEFAKINGSSLLLWNTERWCFTGGETSIFSMQLSRFEPQNWMQSQLTLTLYNPGQVDHPLIQETFLVDAEGHGTHQLVNWELTIPQVDSARKLKLHAKLCHGQDVITNQWELWVYPANPIVPEPTGREIFIHYLSRHLVEKNHRMVRHFTIPMPLGNNLLVTGFLLNGMLDAVYHGARMLLLAQPDTFEATVKHNAFKPCWWMQDAFFYINRSNNTQTANIIEDHPSLAEISHESGWDLNWFHLVEQRHAIELEKLNFPVTPIVYGLGQKLEKRAYLFEFAYGNGAVLVSTLNFEKTNMKHPEVRYIFECLLDYCDSQRFAPIYDVTPELLAAALKDNQKI